jgi:hypothetical protein
MSAWTNIRNAIEAFFSGPVWNFIKPIVLVIESQGGQMLITAAENAVAAGFAAGGGGPAMMAAALTVFETEVVKNGLPFIESQARALIELALQKAKAAVPAPAAV